MLFDQLGLDQRLCQALAQQQYTEPTPIQEKSIPLALEEKKDIVARARTGSGKTAAYLVPIIQKIISSPRNGNRALIIVPSRELADQVAKTLSQLCVFVVKQVTFVNIAQKVPEKVRESLLASAPNIIVATPSAAKTHLSENNINGQDIEFVVFDEADLLVSYGYKEDLDALKDLLEGPKQTWLMSATLDEDVDALRDSFCRKPVTLRLQDSLDENQLQQYYVKCGELDKFLLAYVIFKLGLIKGKTIIFVNDIDRCYRLRLFFEQFGIKSCALNAELPMASRLHITEEFNKNVYNLLIATDEAHNTDKRKRNDSEYGVSRGLDFKNVACVVNFDLPATSKAYTHRIGRTARANASGMALSFVVPKDMVGKHKTASLRTAKRDESVLERIVSSQTKMGNDIKPYQFDMSQVDSFRYRMEDAFRSVTTASVRHARINELQKELLNSDKLQRHFQENPEDLASLRHDKEMNLVRAQPELKRVPEYLLPQSAKVTKPIYVHPKRPSKHHSKKKKKLRKRDPLKSFGR